MPISLWPSCTARLKPSTDLILFWLGSQWEETDVDMYCNARGYPTALIHRSFNSTWLDFSSPWLGYVCPVLPCMHMWHQMHKLHETYPDSCEWEETQLSAWRKLGYQLCWDIAMLEISFPHLVWQYVDPCSNQPHLLINISVFWCKGKVDFIQLKSLSIHSLLYHNLWAVHGSKSHVPLNSCHCIHWIQLKDAPGLYITASYWHKLQHSWLQVGELDTTSQWDGTLTSILYVYAL
jgi:hypothetical protein